MRLTRRTAGIALAVILLGGAASTAAFVFWPGREKPKPPAPSFIPDKRIQDAHAAISRAKHGTAETAPLMKPGDCCCRDGCTMCILERGVCTCADDAVRRSAVCAECFVRLNAPYESPQLNVALDELAAVHHGEPEKLREAKLALVAESPVDQRIDRLKQDGILPDDLVLLSRRARRDPDVQHAIRDPKNPCWLEKQNVHLREALILIELIKEDLNAEEPKLYECCCSVSCNMCLLKYGSCGCAAAIEDAQPEEGPRGVGRRKVPRPCAECVRMWNLHPENGTALFQPLDEKQPPRPPYPEELEPAKDAVPHPKTVKPPQ